MAKHTPGPWEVGELERNEALPIYGGNATLVADVNAWWINTGWAAAEQPMANAMLIAAAPELLAALVEVRKKLAALNSGSENIWAAADAAILKATRQPTVAP
jgi:hypothetical protein